TRSLPPRGAWPGRAPNISSQPRLPRPPSPRSPGRSAAPRTSKASPRMPPLQLLSFSFVLLLLLLAFLPPHVIQARNAPCVRRTKFSNAKTFPSFVAHPFYLALEDGPVFPAFHFSYCGSGTFSDGLSRCR